MLDTSLSLYCPLVKMDPVKRLVYGYASTEALDSQGEIVSREALAQALPEYLRFGNIREMHQLSAVGKAKQATLDRHGLYLAAKIVDDAAWAKVKEGVYGGFSIGGRKLAKRDDTITAMTLTEISLVDRPANPECVIDLVKVAAPIRKVAERQDVSPADKQRAESEYGDVEYADAKNKKYPIDTEAHIRAAWNYLSKEKNAQKYSAEDLKTIKGKVVAAWKKKIDPKGPPAAQEGKVAKGMYGVAQLAALVEALDQFRISVQVEADLEGDASPMAAQVAACVEDLAGVLKDYVAEETAELVRQAPGAGEPEDETESETDEDEPDVMQMIATTAGWPSRPVRKAGARHSAGDQEKVDAIHRYAHAIGQTAQALGSQFEPEEADEDDEDHAEDSNGKEDMEADEEEEEEEEEKVTKGAQTLAKMAGALATVQAENRRLTTRVAELESRPAAPKGALRVVDKSDDTGSPLAEPEPATALDAIKKAHQSPIRIMVR